MILIRKFYKIVIVVGIIGFAINLLFGSNTFTWLSKIRIAENGLYLYKIDIWGYINNLKNSFSNVARLSLDVPTREYMDIDANILESEFWEGTGNNMALLLDWILFAINLMVYPFRVGGYVLLQAMAVLGINVIDTNAAGGLQWLVNVAEFLKQLSIPYV